MQLLVLLFTAAALLSSCSSSNVNRHNLILDLDNSIEHNVLPTKHRPHQRKFVSITRRPPPVNPHRVGSTLELTCEAMGSPAPTVHWYRNDEPVYEHDLESNEISGYNPSALARVASTLLVTRTAGRDVYTCQVTAGLKSIRASTVVYSTDGSTDLSERAKLIPLAPRILGYYTFYVDTIGSDIVLPCRAKGHPRPHVTWTDRNGASVKKNPRMRVLRSGELVISSLQWADMEEFTCRATNVFGSQSVTTFVYPARAG